MRPLRTSPRIEPITPGIAKQVERKHSDRYGKHGKDDRVGRIKKVASRVDWAVALRYE